MKRIGLFGGTFNPIHFGHLRAAVEVKAAFDLDKIYLIPSATPPHKDSDGIADARDRFNMINRAVSNDPDFAVSDVELKRSGPSYTIDTVVHFKSILPAGSTLYFVVGIDAFLEIDTWKSYRSLFSMTRFVVMTRPGIDTNDATVMQKKVNEYLLSGISDGYAFSPLHSKYVHPEKEPIFLFEITLMDISSSKIRRLVNTGGSIRFLVPEKVETFIKKRGLYL